MMNETRTDIPDKTEVIPPSVKHLTEREAYWDVKHLIQFLDETMWVPAEKRNFRINVRGDDKKPGLLHLTIERNDGQQFELDDMLPDGFVTIVGDGFFCDFEQRVIKIPAERIGDRGDVIAIAHEIGHLLTIKNIDAELQKREHHIVHGTKNESLNTDMFSGQAVMEQLRDKLESPGRNKWIRGVMAERQAHAVGLQILRSLKEAGLEVFADFGSPMEALKTVDALLSAYEITRRMDLSDRQLADPNYRPYIGDLNFQDSLEEARRAIRSE